MAADQGIIDSVSNVNTKNLGDAPAFYSALAMANAVQSQNRLNGVFEAAVSASIKNLLTISPEQAQADATVSSAGLPAIITALLAALASGQQSVKTAQTTPPVYVDPNNGKPAA